MRVELPSGTGDEAYLAAVQGALRQAFAQFQPDLVVYNAGTDILQGGCRTWLGVGMSALDVVKQPHKSSLHLHAFAAVMEGTLTSTSHPAAVCFAGDPLGRMSVSAAGVVRRDEMVWRAALDHRVPIVQLLR